MGAALNPDYFYQKVKLFVALAPIVRIDHTTNSGLVTISAMNEVLPPVISLTHAYDLLPYNYGTNAPVTSLCTYFTHLCIKIDTGIYDWNDKVNNV